jgi:hypothetical protein
VVTPRKVFLFDYLFVTFLNKEEMRKIRVKKFSNVSTSKCKEKPKNENRAIINETRKSTLNKNGRRKNKKSG